MSKDLQNHKDFKIIEYSELIKRPVELPKQRIDEIKELADLFQLSVDEMCSILLCYTLSTISDNEAKSKGIFKEVKRARETVEKFEDYIERLRISYKYGT